MTGGPSTWQGDAYYWHRRQVQQPISVSTVLELADAEVDRIFAPVQDIVAEARQGEADVRRLVVQRRLHFEKGWVTASLVWGDLELITDDEVTGTSIVVRKPRRRDKSLEKWSLLDPMPTPEIDIASQPRLLVNTAANQAFYSNEEFDRLSEAGMLTLVLDGYSSDHRQWTTERSIPLHERPPEAEEAPELYRALKSLANFPAQLVSAGLQESIQGAFLLIPSVRESQVPLGTRSPTLPQQIVVEINTQLGDLSNVSAEESARRLRDTYLEFTGKRLRDHPLGLLIEDEWQSLPFSHHGGGDQAVLALLKRVFEGPDIIALEEPEAHLHPVLARRLFDYLKRATPEQQIFVTTHSPIMMDKSSRENNWLLEIKSNGSSSPRRLETDDDVRLVQAQLGCVPSDAYGKDVVLFVEGGTESEVAFPIWAQKLDRPFPDNFGVIRLGGKDRLLESLRIWLGIVKNSPVHWLVALDADAGTTRQKVVKELGVAAKSIRLMSWRGLEDTYPVALIVSAIQSLFPGPALTEGDIPARNRSAFIQTFLQENGVNQPWKLPLSSYVAAQMTSDDIPADFVELLNEIDGLMP